MSEKFVFSDLFLYFCEVFPRTVFHTNNNMNKTLQFSDIPGDWAICFQNDCPLAATCMRYHAAMLVPADLQHHNCVLPGARRDNDCTCFVENRPVRLAYGMKNLLPRMTYEKSIALRRELYNIFGCKSQYYRYSEGRWPISPSQQARVAELFRRFGLETEPSFDAYTEEYYFDK